MAGFSKYPNQIDSSIELPPTTDNVTPVKAEVVNRLRDAILAIESELGIDPSREYGTVRDRLDFLSTHADSASIEILQDGAIILPSAIGLDFVGNVNVTIPQPLRARIEVIGGQATQIQETITISSDGETSLTLAETPIQSDGVMMFVNGVKQQNSVDYSVSGNVVTYTGSVSLLTTDKVEIWYLIDLGGISSTASINAKIRVYITSNHAGEAVDNYQIVSWQSLSSLVTSKDMTLGDDPFFAAPDCALISGIDGHFICQGQLTIQPTVDTVDGIILEVVLNGLTSVHTMTDNGSTWAVGTSRSLSFSFPIDLVADDKLVMKWKHSGSGPSTTQAMAGDNLSWFGLSEQ